MKAAVFFLSAFLFQAPPAHAQGGVCEVVSYSTYGDVRLVRDASGLLLPQKVRCATVTIRNTDIRKRFVTDFEVTAAFKNGREDDAGLEPEDRFIELAPGGEYTGSVCFGPNPTPIVEMRCGY